MTTYRIGVLADTYSLESTPALPEAIVSVFRGVDLIFHLGDVSTLDVLRGLSNIAPVVAIRGDHDRVPLPTKTIVPISGLRFGLIHGKQRLHRELAGRVAAELQSSHSPWWNGLLQDAVRSFDQVDAILFGHVHRPHMAWHDGIFLFSPGAAFQLTTSASPPTVGLLTITDGKIGAEVCTIGPATDQPPSSLTP